MAKRENPNGQTSRTHFWMALNHEFKEIKHNFDLVLKMSLASTSRCEKNSNLPNSKDSCYLSSNVPGTGFHSSVLCLFIFSFMMTEKNYGT